jgi:hypothetical protein
VPGVVTVAILEVLEIGDVHAYVTPVEGLAVAVNVELVVVQVSTAGVAIVTVGNVAVWLTTALVVPTQPVAVLVTVTV